MIWCFAEIGARPGGPEPQGLERIRTTWTASSRSEPREADSVWGQRQRVNLNAPIPSAWVRWNYFCANKDDDSRPALRGT